MAGIGLGDALQGARDLYGRAMDRVWGDTPSLGAQLATAFPQPLDAGRPGQSVAQAAPPPTKLTPQQWGVLDALNFAAPIDAYHGSPHVFDRFALDKIGTGEGAQAYGHGLYFAENPEIADHYKRTLARGGLFTIDGKPVDVGHPLYDQLNILAHNPSFDVEGAKADALAKAAAGGPFAKSYAAEPAKWDQAAALAGRLKKNEGQFYKVRLDAEPGDLLHWEKPLSEQPAAVKSLAAQHFEGMQPLPSGVRLPHRLPSDTTGADLYDMLRRRLGSPEAASAALREAGIPGLRYLDAGSRGAGDGTSNIVMFDDKPIQILERNGQPLPGALPGVGLGR